MVDNTISKIASVLGSHGKEISALKEEGFDSQKNPKLNIRTRGTVNVGDSFRIRKQLIGDAFILGHPVNGKLGTSPYTLGDTDLGAASYVSVGHTFDTYIERFGNTLFIDTGATTATIDTSSFDCTFADGTAELLQTTSIFYDSITSRQVNAVTVRLKGTGLANLQVSAATDGGTFVDINQNEDAAVTAGSDLRIKIRNDNADPATLTELKVVYELQ